MFSRDKEMEKQKVMGVENVVYLGGLIGEIVKNKIEEFYPEEVIDAVEANAVVDYSIWTVCDETFLAYKAIKSSPDSEYSEYEKMRGSEELTPFAVWLLGQVCRCKQERIHLDSPHFWDEQGLSRKEKKQLARLTALEEKVLEYSWGISTGERMTPEEIANLPEFDCDPSWIMRVIKEANDTIWETSVYRVFSEDSGNVVRKENESNV